jgi:predicted transcriptional regulator
VTAPARERDLLGQVRAGVDAALAYLRGVDPDAAAELAALRGRELVRPAIAVVGETKRGKSSLVNALIGVPGLSPVDAAVATSAYLEFGHGTAPAALAHVPGREEPVPLSPADLRDWGTVLGRLPDGVRPPRRIEVTHPAPLLRYLTLVDTPGVGGLDAAHGEIALDAAARATALLFVVDASSPFTQPELDFLVEAAKRLNVVVFALTKIDGYPGWRTILDENRAQLLALAPRFGSAPWYPVSARLAELALTTPGAGTGELVAESRVAGLQHALVELAGRGHLLDQANVLRAGRSELVRVDQDLGRRIAATEPDPADAQMARQERAALSARKRVEARQWSLALNTETQRARVEVTALLRQYAGQLQEDLLGRLDRAGAAQRAELPGEVDRALQALSIRLSQDLQQRFAQVGERVLAQVFTPQELAEVLGRVNAGLRHALVSKPRRDTPAGDGAIVVVSSAGMAMMAGRYGTLGASALGLAGLAGAGLIIPVVGVGLGLGVGAFLVWKRRALADAQQQRAWLREVVGEARATLSDEIAHRFTDLQYALTVALDDAVERRLARLDAHIAEIDRALADDRAGRARRRAELVAQREALRARVTQVDEVLARVRQLMPAGAAEVEVPGGSP